MSTFIQNGLKAKSCFSPFYYNFKKSIHRLHALVHSSIGSIPSQLDSRTQIFLHNTSKLNANVLFVRAIASCGLCKYLILRLLAAHFVGFRVTHTVQ